MDGRFTNWCFTSYEKEITRPECHYLVYQKEKCPTTGKDHYQGYVEFDDKYSMAMVKKLFNDPKLHLEKRKGSQKQAIVYVTKKETRIEDPVIYGKPKNQGRRTELDELHEDIMDGLTAREMLIRHGGNALRNINVIRRGLMVFHRLDLVDDHILANRHTETRNPNFDEPMEDIPMENINTMVQDQNRETELNNPAFDLNQN